MIIENEQDLSNRERAPQMPTEMHNAASGLAALAICESLLLAMGDLKIMGESEVVGIVADAASAHRGAGSTPQEKAMHLAVADILDRIVSGGNSIRRA
ncbi:MAG: hypothetical protein ACOYLQ_06105 [Hyphomicrobiaceae bacterium]